MAHSKDHELQYSRDESGGFRCGICVFSTPHEGRMVNHLVKSHGAERPEPGPLELATPKGRKLAEAAKKKAPESAMLKQGETAVLLEAETKNPLIEAAEANEKAASTGFDQGSKSASGTAGNGGGKKK